MEAESEFGKDTWVGSASPNKNHNEAQRLKLKTGEAFAYLRPKNPVPPGLSVVSATYTVYANVTADWTGTKTLTARRASEREPFGTMTWNTKPGVVGSSAVTAVTDAVNGQAIQLDVTDHVQAWVDGDPNYGWRITSDSATAHKIYGYESDYPPVLSVVYALSPSQPADLSPSGGAVAAQFPVFTFDAVDLENPSDMSALQVQIDAAGDFTTGIDFDTATAFPDGVPASTPAWDSSTSAWAGIADAATVYWRVRYKSGEGVWGDWSDAVSFSRSNLGTVTITNPAASPNNYVEEATPPILWTFSGTQVAWRVRILDAADPTIVVADSGKRDGTDGSWTPPAGAISEAGAYTVEVRAWDSVDRVVQLYASASRDFTFTEDALTTAPTMVSAVQVGGSPTVKVTITRGTAPDSWTLLVDGVVVVADIDPADTLTTGTTHEILYAGASPQKVHDFEVRAVVDGKSSPKSAAGSVGVYPDGIWLLDPDNDIAVVLFDRDEGTWASPDQAATFYPVDGSVPVRIVSAVRGLEGSITGLILDAAGQTLDALEAGLYALKSRPTRPVQLVLADVSMSVLVSNLAVSPRPETQDGDIIKRVAFDFVQVGNFPWES